MTKVGLLNDTSDPAPAFGSPDSTGLVLVDCRVFYNKKTDNILDLEEVAVNALEKAADLNQAHLILGGILLNDNGKQVEGKAFGVDWSGSEKLIIFSNVEPSEYHLTQLTVEYGHWAEERAFDYENGEYYDERVWQSEKSTIDIPANALEELTVYVKPSKTIYIGKLRVFDARGDGDNEYQISSYPKNEITAFKRLIKKYKESPWVSFWEKRLNDLEEPDQKNSSR